MGSRIHQRAPPKQTGYRQCGGREKDRSPGDPTSKARVTVICDDAERHQDVNRATHQKMHEEYLSRAELYLRHLRGERRLRKPLHREEG